VARAAPPPPAAGTICRVVLLWSHGNLDHMPGGTICLFRTKLTHPDSRIKASDEQLK